MGAREKLRPGWKRCPQCQCIYLPAPRRRGAEQKFCSKECRVRNRNFRLHPTRHELDGQDYAEIIALFESGEWSYGQLAEKYHKTHRMIWSIVNVISGEYHPVQLKRTCLWCGKDFIATMSRQQYCKPTHASQAAAKRRKVAQPAQNNAV